MRIAYLHGLESIGRSEKNVYLHDTFSPSEVFDPPIDYMEKDIFTKLYIEIKNFNADVIVGSSMGGRFAYHIGNLLSVDTILFNPALVSRNPIVGKVEIIHSDGDGNNRHFVTLGVNDNVVLPNDIISYLEVNTKHYDVNLVNHKHRVPYDLFVNTINKYVTSTSN